MLHKTCLMILCIFFSITSLSACAKVTPVSTVITTPTIRYQEPEVIASQIILPEPTPTIRPDLVPITVYFTDQYRYAAGTPPFEAEVTRMVPSSSNLPEAVLIAFFKGPTIDEREDGLEAITSGFKGVGTLTIRNGIARVYLNGECASLGATYTIAQPIMRNLLQFEDISYVKIYDENGDTEEPEGETNSIPFCLEP